MFYRGPPPGLFRGILGVLDYGSRVAVEEVKILVPADGSMGESKKIRGVIILNPRSE